MSAAFDTEFRDPPDADRVCQRCGKEKGDVEKRPTREWICKSCWSAINAGEPIRISTHWEP